MAVPFQSNHYLLKLGQYPKIYCNKHFYKKAIKFWNTSTDYSIELFSNYYLKFQFTDFTDHRNPFDI